MSGVHLAKETIDRFVSDSHPAGTNVQTPFDPFEAVKHGVSGNYDAILLCFVHLSLKGRDAPWWQALLDHTGPFCMTAPSTQGPMHRR